MRIAQCTVRRGVREIFARDLTRKAFREITQCDANGHSCILARMLRMLGWTNAASSKSTHCFSMYIYNVRMLPLLKMCDVWLAGPMTQIRTGMLGRLGAQRFKCTAAPSRAYSLIHGWQRPCRGQPDPCSILLLYLHDGASLEGACGAHGNAACEPNPVSLCLSSNTEQLYYLSMCLSEYEKFVNFTAPLVVII